MYTVPVSWIPFKNPLSALLLAFGCAAAPAFGQVVLVIGDSGVESVDVPPSVLAPFDTLVLGNTATGDGTLNFSAGTLTIGHAGGYSGFATVGHDGIGQVNQSNADGDSIISITGPQYVSPAPLVAPDPWGGYLFIARNDGSSGGYSVSDSGNGNLLALNVQNQIQIGGSNISTQPGGGFTCAANCIGSFVQDGGVVTAGAVTIGIGAGQGTYALNSGTLNAAIDLGNSSAGPNAFNQIGGVVNASEISIGDVSSARGVYTLDDGTVAVSGLLSVGRGDNSVDSGLAGLFKQNGGDLTASEIQIGGAFINAESRFGRGRYELSAGTVTSDATVVGNLSQGSVLQIGGTFNAGDLSLGSAGLFSVAQGGGVFDYYSSGTYELQGGQLNTSNTLVSVFGLGTFSHSGGGHAVAGDLVVGSQPALIEPVSGQTRQGAYSLSGGLLTVGGTATVGAGNSTFPGEAGALGVFTQSGGTATLDNDLIIGGGGDIAGGQGTYNMTGGSGVLSVAGDLRLGQAGLGSGSLGTMNHSAGQVTSNGLLLGSGNGSGTYNLSGSGSLSTGITYVGEGGQARFNQSGGTHDTAFLNIGVFADSNSIYSMTGGTINVAGNLNVGGPGATGTAQMLHSAGAVNVNDPTFGLFVNNHGQYSLGGTATLAVAANVTLGGNGGGYFGQSGAATTHTIGGNLVLGDQAGDGGQYVLGAGALSVAGQTIVGDRGSSQFGQSGGAFNTGSLMVGARTGGTGDFFVNAGSAVVAGNSVVANEGTGFFNVAGAGTFSTGGDLVLANLSGSSATGSAISGGTVNVGARLMVGGNGSASFAQVNSNVTTAGLYLAAGATSVASYTLNGGMLDVQSTAGVGGGSRIGMAGTGTFTQEAGTHQTTFMEIGGATFGQGGGGSGTYQLNGGALVASGTISVKPSGTAGVLNVAGGSVSAPAIVNNDRVNYTGGSIAANVSNNAQFSVGGAGTRTLTGDLANNAGGVVTVAAGTPFVVTGALTNAATASIQAGANITIGRDYNNLASGSGNTYDRRANVTGPGQILAAGAGAATAQTLSGNLTGPTTPGNATLDFGTVRVGQASTLFYAIGNSNTGGPDLRGAIQTSVNGANLIDARLSGAGVTAGTWGPVVAGGTTGNLGVTFTASSGGALVDQKVAIVNNFENTNSQVLTITGNAFNMAVGSATPSPIVFANRHVGDAAVQALTVTNTAPGGGMSEALNASFSGSTGNAAHNGGSIGNLAAGSSNGSAMSVSLDTSAAGARSGSVTLAYQSDGTGPNGNSGLSAITAGSQTIAISGDVYRLASANAISAVNFGNVHVGDTVNQALVITNTAANDGFSERLNASFGAVSDGRITTTGSISLLGAGQTNSASMVVGLNTAAAGSVSGTARVLLVSDGSGTSELGQTGLASQDVGVSGTITTVGSVFRLASPSAVAPNPVNFGNVRVGAATDQALTLSNTAANDGFSEKLNASIGGATTGVTSNGGSFALLGPQATDSTSLRVGLDTSTAGAKNGTAVITLVSDGAGTSGLGQTALPSQTVTITGGVFNEAVGAATPAPIVMHRRVGETATQVLTVSNTAAAGSFSEALNASFSGSTGNASHNGAGISNLIAGGSNSVSMSVSLDTSSAGVRSGSVTLAYQTDGTGPNGNSGLAAAATAAGSQTIAVSGNVYTAAVGQVAPATIDFGIVHRGDVVAARAVGVTNAAPVTALNDRLTGEFTGASGPFSAGGTLGAGVLAGQTDNASLLAGLDTQTAGLFSGNAMVSLRSSNPDMADLLLGDTPIGLLAQVNDYANLNFLQAGGSASLSRSGNVFTLDFGNVGLGSGLLSAALRVKNDTGPVADFADGSFCLPGFPCSLDALLAFSLAGFNDFFDLGAGDLTGLLSIGFDTSTLGLFEDSILLSGFGHNASGYREALDGLTLQIRGNVFDVSAAVSEPRALLLMGLGLLLLAVSQRRWRAKPSRRA